MSAPWHGGLCALALRRGITGAALWLALPLGVLLALHDWAPPEELLGYRAYQLGGALARQGIWFTLLFFFAPLLVYRSAATIPLWRRGEADWLGSSPAPRAAIVLATWCGAALAGALMLAVAAVCAEIGAGSNDPHLAHVGAIEAPRVVLLESGKPVRWAVGRGLEQLTSERVMRAHLALAGGGEGGPAAEVEFSAERKGVETKAVRRVFAGRATLELAVPGHAGPLELAFERIGPGAVVVLVEPGIELFELTSNGLRASLAIAARALLALSSALAIAFGLGAWMSAATATTLTLCALLPAWLADGASSAWPWAGLPAALDLVGDGFAPAWPAAATIAGAVAACVLGLALPLVHRDLWRRSG